MLGEKYVYRNRCTILLVAFKMVDGDADVLEPL